MPLTSVINQHTRYPNITESLASMSRCGTPIPDLSHSSCFQVFMYFEPDPMSNNNTYEAKLEPHGHPLSDVILRRRDNNDNNVI